MKYHSFKEKSFQGLVYCDYCGKLLWGLAKQGVHCSACSEMVVQCRPSRRLSPDSLSVTDSEAESVSKYSTTSPRGSIDIPHQRQPSILNVMDESSRPGIKRSSTMTSEHTKVEEPLRSPTDIHSRPLSSSSAKSYRKALKQHVQTDAVLSPQATAKAFTRLVAQTSASQALMPRFDESTPEYYVNLERTQQMMLFLIRLYDNLAYHLQHVILSSTMYQCLLLGTVIISISLMFFGRWIVLAVGLIVLLNKTWLGSSIEVFTLFLLELVQTVVELVYRKPVAERKTMEISIYENQRWWAGSGYTPQLLRSERKSWSNITGTEPFPNKDEMPPPPSYEWADDGWKVDTTGPWADDLLDMGKHFWMMGCIIL
ncbi:uncharacterized protein BYT42DRAFT_592880 [Radiomyces spectabilis]|uniref:uncharacterized protein n=1 Tax=Radiomyces spectabilis TaxID=64574 RepID=UPI00221ECF83|nr:uncharacterized protein BYT42DRAFT_592880 [Radiomyces spectabilis]KAI8384830.1 hypothetical protein BYT42DRAFT_592880 [Radiomyces spectabilis]